MIDSTRSITVECGYWDYSTPKSCGKVFRTKEHGRVIEMTSEMKEHFAVHDGPLIIRYGDGEINADGMVEREGPKSRVPVE